MSQANQSKGFVQYGNEETNQDYSYENAIIGDREGLTYLRNCIDQVLDSGEEVLLDDEIDTEFTFIKLGERAGILKVESSTLWSAGCFVICIVLIGLMVLGGIKMFEIFELFTE